MAKRRSGRVDRVSGRATKRRRTKAEEAAATKTANPFSRVGSVAKRFVVLNRRVKGANRDLSKARSKAISVRKQALLDELQRHEQNKHSAFVDERFGQQDDQLDQDERAVLRFKAQRQRTSSSMFALEDKDDEEEEMTHFGAKLSDVLKHETDAAEKKLREEREEDAFRAEMEMEHHFGGGDGDKPRSRLEIMQEVVAKSKAFKAQRQMERDEDTKLLSEVDDAWAEIRFMMDYAGDSRRRDNADEETTADVEMEHRDVEFDTMAKTLAMEVTNVASDRRKTDEEIARERRNKLEELEKARQARMMGEDSVKKQQKQPKKSHSNSAETDGEVAIDPEFVLESSDEDSDGVVEFEQTVLDLGGCEEEEDDEDATELGEDGQDPTKPDGGTAGTSAHKVEQVVKEDLPFTFPMPSSVDEFASWVDHRSDEDLALVIQRLVACHHRSLSPDNAVLLQRILAMLVTYFSRCCDSLRPGRLDVLTTAIHQLSAQFPGVAAALSRQGLSSLRRQAGQRLHYPSAGLLLLQRLWGRVFSCSDASHVWATPARLVLGQCLSQLHISGGRDLVAALFTLDLLCTNVSEHFCVVPEALPFLHSLLLAGFGVDAQCFGPAPPSIPSWWTGLQPDTNAKLCFSWLWKENNDEVFSGEEFRSASLQAVLASVSRCVDSLAAAEIASLPEMVAPLIALMESEAIKDMDVLQPLKGKLKEAAEGVRAERRPLYEEPKPKQIRSLEPLFDEQFVPGKDNASERKKLEKAIKEAKRSARRELRKDAAFVEAERRRVADQRDEELQKKHKSNMAFLEAQQADTNVMQKYKRKAK